MKKISRDEIIKLAQMSAIDIHEDEIQPLIEQVGSVLSYAQRVKEVARTVEVPSNKNMNVFREDVVVKTDYRPLMAQAPQEEGNYFVVPTILDHK